MTTYQTLLKRLAKDGPTYDNWLQHEALAYLTAKDSSYQQTQERFFELARLTEFTQDQVLDGLELPEETYYCNYKWSEYQQDWVYDS